MSNFIHRRAPSSSVSGLAIREFPRTRVFGTECGERFWSEVVTYKVAGE